MFFPRFAIPVLPLVAILVAFCSLSAGAAEPLVDVAWVKANLAKPGIAMLDVRSGAGVTREVRLKGRILGAIFTDYAKDGWREKSAAGVEAQLPSAEKLEQVIGRFGIDNASHVVLIPEGRNAIDVGAATRLYWTFKVLGHDNVSIQDGGHTAWVAEIDKDKKPVNPLETTDVVPSAKRFVAKMRSEMLVSKGDM